MLHNFEYMFLDGVSRPRQHSYIKWANSFDILCKETLNVNS